MQPQGLLPCSQESPTSPDPKSDESTSYHHILFL
jgi:hypothetical protein